LTIRCKKCRAVVPIRLTEEDVGLGSVSCSNCGSKYTVNLPEKSSRPGRSLSERAQRLAAQHGIDRSGAYSIILGIMTPDELRKLEDPNPTPVAPDDDRRKHHYDRAFRPAVDSGKLTARQAAERGNREAYAGILSSRHGLAHEESLAVADNRCSLLEAIRLREQRKERETAQPGVARGRISRAAVLTAVLAVLVVLAFSGFVTRDRRTTIAPNATPGMPRAVGAASVTTDDSGRIVEVIGPDPRTVLRTFCVEAAKDGRYEPLDVVPSSRLGARARLGLFRDPRHPEDLLAISILEDRESSHWRAGDGHRPLVASPAPVGAEQAVQKK
jgi:hypothetical protein